MGDFDLFDSRRLQLTQRWANLQAYRSDKVQFLFRAMLEGGDIVDLSVGWQRVFVVSEPSLIVEVLQSKTGSYRPSKSYVELERLIGKGLVTTEGEEWTRQRTALNPLFLAGQLDDFAVVSAACTRRMITRLIKAGQLVDLESEMHRLMLEIMTKAFFGDSWAGQESFSRDFDLAHDYVMARIESRSWLRTLPSRIAFRNSKSRLDRAIANSLSNTNAKSATFVGRILAANQGGTTSRNELRDQLLTLMVASFETTATALTWTLFSLASQPEHRRQIELEATNACGDSFPDLTRLNATTCFIHESLRLLPPVWAISREAAKTVTLGGRTIPAGSKIAISVHGIHRHPDYWEAPNDFAPERFDRNHRPAPRIGAYMPFGVGSHSCLGQKLAMLVMKTIVGEIASRCRLNLVDEWRPAFRAGVFLKPAKRISLTIQAAP